MIEVDHQNCKGFCIFLTAKFMSLHRLFYSVVDNLPLICVGSTSFKKISCWHDFPFSLYKWFGIYIYCEMVTSNFSLDGSEPHLPELLSALLSLTLIIFKILFTDS